jgi:hypothetical protein
LSTDSPTRDNARLHKDVLKHLDASIQADIDDGNIFGASIIVARGGVIGHRRTFGTVAPEWPAADDDLYLAMSVSKSFTLLWCYAPWIRGAPIFEISTYAHPITSLSLGHRRLGNVASGHVVARSG